MSESYAPSTPSRRSTRKSVSTPLALAAPVSAKLSVKKAKSSTKSVKSSPGSPKSSTPASPPPRKSSMKKRNSSQSPSPKKSVSISKRGPRSRSATPSIKKRAASRKSVAVESDDDKSVATGEDTSSETSSPVQSQKGIVAPDASTSAKRRRGSAVLSDNGEWPLPFDIVWLCAFSLAAFALAFGAIHPEETLKCFAKYEYVAGCLRVLLPFDSRWQIFMRCAIFFVIGGIPVRRWANNHLQETKVPAEVMTAAVQGMIKLAIIQYFMFKQGEIDHQAAILHASLGFAVQDFILNARSVSSAGNLYRFIEIAGNAVILLVPDEDIICKAMFYTLTVLSLSSVLRALLVVASSRSAYRSFRRAVMFSDTVLVVAGVPFIAQYLLNNMDAAPTAPLTISSVMAPLACATVLFSSIVLQHLDLFFN